MKIFFAAVAVCLLSLSLPAQEAQEAQAEQPWDFISFTFVPGVPQTADVFNVYGVKVGVPVGFGSGTFVAGVEGSIFASMSDEVYGVQAAPLFNSAKRLEGLQASTLVNNADTVKGLQFGIVNFAKDKSFQIGIVNIIKDSSVPFVPFVNFLF